MSFFVDWWHIAVLFRSVFEICGGTLRIIGFSSCTFMNLLFWAPFRELSYFPGQNNENNLVWNLSSFFHQWQGVGALMGLTDRMANTCVCQAASIDVIRLLGNRLYHTGVSSLYYPQNCWLQKMENVKRMMQRTARKRKPHVRQPNAQLGSWLCPGLCHSPLMSHQGKRVSQVVANCLFFILLLSNLIIRVWFTEILSADTL